jgi:hypothetical protein
LSFGLKSYEYCENLRRHKESLIVDFTYKLFDEPENDRNYKKFTDVSYYFSRLPNITNI